MQIDKDKFGFIIKLKGTFYMETKYALTLDFGTQSVRAMIFDNNGNILGGVKKPYPSAGFTIKPGYLEQDPILYYETMCLATKELKSKHEDLFNNLQSVALTCFRDTALLLDKDLKPIRPCILWLDQRIASVPKFPFIQNILFTLSGMKDTVMVNRRKTMARWYQENEKDNWSKTYKYVNISTYLNYRLCGELKDSMSNMTGHYPIDFKKKRWLKKHQLKRCVFDVDDAKLCEIVSPESVMGYVTKKAAEETGIPEGLPFISAGSDKSCESLGCGTIDEYSASISYGTASTIEITSKKYVEPETFLPAYASALKGYYNSEVQIYRGYWMMNWFIQEFCEKEKEEYKDDFTSLINHLLDKVKDIPIGSEGLMISPYWGPSLKRPNARGAMIGFSDVHTKYHILRAIIEGIAYSLRESMEIMEKKFHKKVKILAISGGGSRSDIVSQITADIFGLPIYKVQTEETSSLGAAIVSYLTFNVFATPEEAIENMVHHDKIYMPNLENHKQYNEYFYNVYLKIYSKLKKMNKTLRKMNQSDC